MRTVIPNEYTAGFVFQRGNDRIPTVNGIHQSRMEILLHHLIAVADKFHAEVGIQGLVGRTRIGDVVF